MTDQPFFTARVIASALGVSQKSVHRRAKRESWQNRSDGYRVEYAVPRALRRLCKTRAGVPSILYQDRLIRELSRAAAVLGFVQEMRRDPRGGVEHVLDATVKNFHHLISFSKSSLRGWIAGVERDGLPALKERKAGHVGRKSARLERILR